MLLERSTAVLLLEDISILRDSRQRREIDTSDLDESIRRNGVIQPIIVRPRRISDEPGTRPEASSILVAGERRYTASLKAGHKSIPIVHLQDLPPDKARIVELEENVKRRELPWRDEVSAIGELHLCYLAENPDHTQDLTAKALSLSPSTMSIISRVFRDLASPKIARATTCREAYNILKRVDERAMEDAVSDLMDASTTISEEIDTKRAEPKAEPTLVLTPAVPVTVGEMAAQIQRPLAPSQMAQYVKPKIKPAEDSILLADFIKWAPTYAGPRFNLIHCDFPYGIEAFGGPMSGADKWETYDDTAGSYWGLLRALAANMDRLCAPSAHMFFWFSMEWYQETLDFFEDNMGDWTVQPFPLIWHKNDNVGVLPDSTRGPRRVYETALFASRGDRLIMKPISNLKAAPTDKKHHHSTKPEPVLEHFFQMTVDENTKLLDPTCGSGSALRAAESMGATYVLGLESSPEHCENARKALRSFRVLREASNG